MEEHHYLLVTKLLNLLFARPVDSLLQMLRIPPADPNYPIPNHVSMEVVVFFFAGVFFIWLKRRISVGRPGGAQQCMELLLTNSLGLGINDMLADNIGHEYQKYVPMIGGMGLFVMWCNLISLIPGFESPTAEKSVPLGCASVVFLYYNWQGIHHHGGFRYGLQFLKMPIEIFSHLARVLSLTVRLFVNMFVSETLYAQFLALTLALFIFAKQLNPIGYLTIVAPLTAPLAFIVLHIFVGIVQAFVFTILPTIYLTGAVSEGH